MLPTVVTVTLVFTQSKNIMLMFYDYSLVGKVFLSIVTFDQLGGPDRLADWSGRFRQVISPRPMMYQNFSVTNFLGQ